MVGSLLGGVGLFLLGMGLLTDGLTTLAGDALRSMLRRYTRTRLSGVVVGAVATGLVQSSSVVTVMTIGFVGAGLLPFAQALGVIYGANVGTTTTSWIIATFGLKVKISAVALPLVGVGAAGRLFSKGRRASLFTAVSGFGLLFVGLDVLQTGMQGLAERTDLASFGRTGFLGDVLLVGAGAAMTVVMQSSSAAVATTLAAVHGGAIGLEAAAALVIGQNVGTTVTALLGAIGGSIPARRVAAAHVVFNVGTAIVALALLPVFVRLIVRTVDSDDPAVLLTAFHSAFNVLGVAMFLPLSDRLVSVLQQMLPEPGRALTRRLSTASAATPVIAVEAARQTAVDVATVIFGMTRQLLTNPDKTLVTLGRTSEELRHALGATREHLQAVKTDASTPTVYRQHVGVLHALDHLQRLLEASEQTRFALAVRKVPECDLPLHELGLRLDDATRWVASPGEDDVFPLQQTSRMLARFRQERRQALLEQTARGELSAVDAEAWLDALRWMDRLGYHAWRAAVHLERADRDSSQPEPLLDASGANDDGQQRTEEPHDLAP